MPNHEQGEGAMIRADDWTDLIDGEETPEDAWEGIDEDPPSEEELEAMAVDYYERLADGE